MNQNVILNRLLDKYERSKHLTEPGTSVRRVMLRTEKKELPEYDYQDAAVRDACNRAAEELEQKGWVSLEWVKNRPVLSGIVLTLDHVADCYRQTGRTHPKELAGSVAQAVSEGLAEVSVPWLVRWRDQVCREARSSMKVPSYCKNSLALLEDLLTAFREYDALDGGSISMRAFSSKCYHDTKYFERQVRELFLSIARKFDPALAFACEQEELGLRDQLALLGIYARPELYELSGNCTVHTTAGSIDLAAAAPWGFALPSTAVDAIAAVDLSGIRRVLFIENKTNYDEYLLSQWRQGELVVYHGGFLSPQKRKLFSLLGGSVSPGTEVLFWADIDLGGFQMFAQLQRLMPSLCPWRMSGELVEQYHGSGLKRGEEYLLRLEEALRQGEFPLFSDAIMKILEYGVTIEQEVLLR